MNAQMAMTILEAMRNHYDLENRKIKGLRGLGPKEFETGVGFDQELEALDVAISALHKSLK